MIFWARNIYLGDDDNSWLVRVHLWQETQSPRNLANVVRLEIVLGGEAECLLGCGPNRVIGCIFI